MASFGSDRATSRRSFLAGAAAAGLAVSREARAMRITKPTGLTIGSVDVPVRGGRMPAYRAQQTVFETLPILLLVEDGNGIDERIQEMCRRFAAKGYLAVAPDLYFRLADPAAIDDPVERAALMDLEPDNRILAGLDDAMAWAGTNGGDHLRVGILGWGRGGRLSWLYATTQPFLKTAVSLYGPLSGRKTENQPNWPLDVAAQVRVPSLGLFGGADPATPPADIDAMQDKLRAAGVENKFFVYPRATAGFDVEDGPDYDPADGDDSFQRCLAWLRSHEL